jgi:hypothetical protein
MRTAALRTEPRDSQSQSKSFRRSAADWVNSHPHRRGMSPLDVEEPTIVRFPEPRELEKGRRLASDEIARRARLVRESWSHEEREHRRVAAVRKQDELMLVLAATGLEDAMRLAVAAGEQPVAAPELEMLD